MSAMHHDSSADLNVVGSKLKNIFEVYKILCSVWIKIFQQAFQSFFILTFRKLIPIQSDVKVLYVLISYNSHNVIHYFIDSI